MITFYRDDTDNFKANIRLGGDSGTQRFARLILEFPSRKILIDGKFNGETVEVEIPTLMDMNDDGGFARLEVIADRTYFEAWSDNFELVNKRSVEVREVSVERSEEITVEVGEVNLDTEVVEEEPLDQLFSEKAAKNDINMSKKFIKNFENKDEILDDFDPAVIEWGNRVFVDAESDYARMAMTELSKKLS